MGAEVQWLVRGQGVTVMVAMDMNSGDGMIASWHGCEVSWRRRGERASNSAVMV